MGRVRLGELAESAWALLDAGAAVERVFLERAAEVLAEAEEECRRAGSRELSDFCRAVEHSRRAVDMLREALGSEGRERLRLLEEARESLSLASRSVERLTGAACAPSGPADSDAILKGLTACLRSLSAWAKSGREAHRPPAPLGAERR